MVTYFTVGGHSFFTDLLFLPVKNSIKNIFSYILDNLRINNLYLF